jgi:hypothetical protein
MAYLGNTPITQSFISGTDYFNGTGAQTAFTLTRTVASVNDIEAVVNNVVQQPNDAYNISGTTITFTSAPSAGTNNVYVRYLSTTTQAITPSQNTVGWAQLNADTQQDLGISFKNRIINSNMAIDQRNAGASMTLTGSLGQYGVDRFAYNSSQASKLTAQQSTTAPTGFYNSNLVTVSSAATIGSGDYFTMFQHIEANNTSDLMFGISNAKTVTLSFWVRSSVTGTFVVGLLNASLTRTYLATYTISAANTWEQKTITVAGDTTGTWTAGGNGVGITVRFDLGSGSSGFGTANTWQAGNFWSVSGSASSTFAAQAGATLFLTGLQLEVGTQATTFTTAGGSYGAELALCQRYCQVFANGNENGPLGFANGVSATFFVTHYGAVVFRAAPSATLTGSLFMSNYSSNIATITGVNNINFAANTNSVRIAFSLNLTPSKESAGFNANAGSLILSSEL